jgi:hypothetical protein
MMTLGANPTDIFGKSLLSDREAALLSYVTKFAYTFIVPGISWRIPGAIRTSLDNIAVLAETRQLNEQLFHRFSEGFGIVYGEREGFRFDPERAGRGQSPCSPPLHRCPRGDHTRIGGGRKVERIGVREDSGQERTEERKENRTAADP